MNRILKQRARQLYSRNFGRLMLVYLLNLVYLLLTAVIPLRFPLWLARQGMNEWESFFVTSMAQLVLMLLLAPLSLGVTRFVYLLQMERGPGVREVFHYLSRPGRYGKAVAAGIIQSFPSYLVLICGALMDGTGSPALEMLLLVLSLGGYVLTIYWTLHICLLPYILVEDEEAQLGHIRRESFRLMRGNCGRYFGLCLSFIGWYLLITAILSGVLLSVMMPKVMDYAQLGLVFPDELMESYVFWVQLGAAVMMTFLAPYVSLSTAGFGAAALQGRMEELAWQGRAPYGGGYPNTTGWQQPGYPPPYGPYPPSYPQGANTTGWPQGAAPWQGQQGWAPQQPADPYTAAQQEEAQQYQRYCQGQPMAARTFTSYGSASDLGGFLPWLQVERSDLYSFLKLEGWMPGMVAAAWQQAAAGMSSQARGTGAVVKRSLEESLNGTRFRVTVIISEDAAAGGWQVCIQVEVG